MSHNAPHIMLLDEPTNHLDIDARHALIEALNAYEGCVILVSHDPHLVAAVADRLYLVKDAGVVPYDGDLDDYRRTIMEQRSKERSEARKSKKAKKTASHATDKATKANTLETELETLSVQKTHLETEMSHPEAIADSARMQQHLDEYAILEQKISDVEAAWFDTQS